MRLHPRTKGQRSLTVHYDMGPFSRVTAVNRIEFFYRAMIERRSRNKMHRVFGATQSHP